MYRNPNKPQKSDVHKMKKPPNKNIKEEAKNTEVEKP